MPFIFLSSPPPSYHATACKLSVCFNNWHIKANKTGANFVRPFWPNWTIIYLLSDVLFNPGVQTQFQGYNFTYHTMCTHRASLIGQIFNTEFNTEPAGRRIRDIWNSGQHTLSPLNWTRIGMIQILMSTLFCPGEYFRELMFPSQIHRSLILDFIHSAAAVPQQSLPVSVI